MGNNRYLSYNEKLPLTTFILDVNSLMEYILKKNKQNDYYFNTDNYTISIMGVIELFNKENFKTKTISSSDLYFKKTKEIKNALVCDYFVEFLNKDEKVRQKEKGLYIENGEIYNSNNEKLYLLNFTSSINEIVEKKIKKSKKPIFRDIDELKIPIKKQSLGAFIVFHTNHFFLDLSKKTIENIFSTLNYVSLILLKETAKKENHQLDRNNLEKQISKKLLHINEFLKQTTAQDCFIYRNNLIDNILKKYNV